MSRAKGKSKTIPPAKQTQFDHRPSSGLALLPKREQTALEKFDAETSERGTHQKDSDASN
jgi:hypothetical protein